MVAPQKRTQNDKGRKPRITRCTSNTPDAESQRETVGLAGNYAVYGISPAGRKAPPAEAMPREFAHRGARRLGSRHGRRSKLGIAAWHLAPWARAPPADIVQHCGPIDTVPAVIFAGAIARGRRKRKGAGARPAPNVDLGSGSGAGELAAPRESETQEAKDHERPGGGLWNDADRHAHEEVVVVVFRIGAIVVEGEHD